MTIVEVAKAGRPGQRFKRASSARELHFSDHEKPKPRVYLVADHYGMTAALFSDDLMADDWEVVP